MRATCLAALVALASGCAESPPESVLFEPAFPELFSEGGALTDAWADVDADGLPDRFVGMNGTPSRLYRNLGDGFEDVAARWGLLVERSVRTSAWGDFDGDGDPDLLLGYAGEAPVTALYRNDGGRFEEVAGDVGLRLDEGVTRQASWIDVDGDGDLDLFLAMRDRANRLFENRGAGGFEDVTDRAGVGDERRSVGALWLDLGDGRPDLLVANMNGDANALLTQAEDGTFAPWSGEVSIRSGGRAVGDDAQGTVRPCAVDYDNDGAFDLFFANYGPNGLFRRTDDGDAPFVNVAEAVGLAIDSRYDTCAWGDVDHDGTPDLFVNGTVGGGTHYRDWLLRREGGERFVDVTPPALLELNASHGATWVDFDRDGDLDLALAGVAEDGTHRLLRNLLRPEIRGRGFHVRVLDGEGHATRPGAEVRVYAAGTDRLLGTRLVDTGSGYDAQSDLPVHFGLAGVGRVDVEVTILAGGDRIVARHADVDPTPHAETPLALWIDRDGTIVRAGLDGGR